jgi:citrate synthase
LVLVAKKTEQAYERDFPINAIGAIRCELGLLWQVCRGLGVMARAVGLIGHLLEESRKPNGTGNLASHRCGSERPYALQVAAAKLTGRRRSLPRPG